MNAVWCSHVAILYNSVCRPSGCSVFSLDFHREAGLLECPFKRRFDFGQVLRCAVDRVVQTDEKHARESGREVVANRFNDQLRFCLLKHADQVAVLPTVFVDVPNELIGRRKQLLEFVFHVAGVLNTRLVRLSFRNHVGEETLFEVFAAEFVVELF